MPSASPIAVIMLTMKKDTEVTWPRTEEMATVTMMDKMAMIMGRNAATSAPKTRTSTIIAAGSPNFSSPLVRSDSESSVKSWSRVLVPVMSTSNAASASAATTSSITATIPVSGSSPSTRVTTAACPSAERPDMSAAYGSRTVCAAPVASIEDRTSPTNAWNCGSSTVSWAE